jgi:hypothetical protein
MMMCGQMLVQKMATAVKGVIMDRRDGQFNVIQVMADESKFSICQVKLLVEAAPQIKASWRCMGDYYGILLQEHPLIPRKMI